MSHRFLMRLFVVTALLALFALESVGGDKETGADIDENVSTGSLGPREVVSNEASSSCKSAETTPSGGKAAILIATFEAMKAHPLGFVAFIFLLTIWTTFALPVTPCEVCAGFVFGPIWGTVGSLFAKTLGCCCALMVGRLVGRSQGWRVPAALDKYLTFLRTSPLQAMCVIRIAPIPLGVKNYGLSLVPFPNDRYPVLEYVWACILVGTPFSIVWCLTGHGASSLVEIAARYT